ncbi:MAG: hypothetical protein V4507_11395 [Verrucomicrobiota bacterium]
MIYISIASVILLFFGVKYLKYHFFEKRAALDLNELFALFNKEKRLKFKLFAFSIVIIADCYGINYKKLRPEDKFSGNLGKIDSWALGDGQDKLEDFLIEMGLSKGSLADVKTLQDLVNILACE